MKTTAAAISLLLVAALAGCASSTNAVIDSLRFSFKGHPDVTAIQLNPEFRYLRVTTSGRTALLVLGYVENRPQSPVEVWYSAEREVLRLQNGRVAGTVGLTTEWRRVVFPALPTWTALGKIGGQTQWRRTRDVMPGYRFGMTDLLSLESIPPPKSNELKGVDPSSLSWFEERMVGQEGVHAMEPLLPVARYAVEFDDGRETVVYGEQCLTPELCLTWPRWPSVQGARGLTGSR